MAFDPMASVPGVPATRWSRGALQPVGRCPACGSGKRGKPMACGDHRGNMASDRWCMWRCEGCRSLYLDPRPDDASLAAAYDQYYTHSAEREQVPDGGMGRLLWAGIHGYLNHEHGFSREPAGRTGYWFFRMLPPFRLKLDYYARHLSKRRFPSRGRLLDVGCGNGAFLARAREMGWEPIGLDPDAEAVATCCAQGLRAFEGSLTALPVGIGAGYDVITLSHSIEHVPDVRAALQGAATLLRPGGTLWMALPNPGGIGARFFGGDWRELHPPYHLCIPTQPVLSRLLGECGYNKVEFLRRGSHARRMMLESAENARVSGKGAMKTALAPWLRLLSDAIATLSPRFAEETVVVAVRGEQ